MKDCSPDVEGQKEEVSTSSDKVGRSHAKDQQIKEKKAMLYDLKNKLLRYESFEEVPIEELESLCEGLHLEPHSSSDKSIDQQLENREKERSQGHHLSHAHIPERSIMVPIQQCCQNVYVVKLKQILVIILVILCIIVKNNIPNSNTYDIGEFSIYQTRYSKTMFIDKAKYDEKAQKEGQNILSHLLGIDQQDEKIKLYLPKQLEKMKKKDQKELTYEKCIDLYHPMCIDHRLSLYGSMNLQLQDWILDHIKGQEKIVFESNVDYLLSIILSALKMKKLEAEGKSITKITIIQSQNLNSIELNSIKLSLIQNQCQNYVDIIKISDRNYDIFSSFTYVFASQEFYIYSIYPFGQNAAQKYPNTSFVLYMPKGMNETLKILLKQSTETLIYDIEFDMKNDKFYREKLLVDREMVFNSKEQKMRIIIVKHYKGQSISVENMLLVPAKKIEVQNQVKDVSSALITQKTLALPQPTSPSQTQPKNNLLKTKSTQSSSSQVVIPHPTIPAPSPQKPKSLSIGEHPCIKEYTYNILPIMSNFQSHVYMKTINNLNLLVSLDKSVQYKQRGAISPELLFFIAQNIDNRDIIFFSYQLYQDDLILTTAALAANSSQRLYCIIPETNHPILSENLRMNGAKSFVSFAYLRMQQEQKIHKFYQQQNFSVFFTTFSFFNRDYKSMYNLNRPKMIIFYWLFDINFFQFLKSITKRHKVWAILERFEKVVVGESCISYGLLQVNQGNILQMDRSWFIVQM